jgi:hypothetical protein
VKTVYEVYINATNQIFDSESLGEIHNHLVSAMRHAQSINPRTSRLAPHSSLTQGFRASLQTKQMRTTGTTPVSTVTVATTATRVPKHQHCTKQ